MNCIKFLPSPLVSTGWLEENLGKENLKIVNASWLGEGHGSSYKDYKQNHIEGAVFFPIDGIADHSIHLPHMMPTAEEFAKAVGHLGITEKDFVVVYDDLGLFFSPRVRQTFQIMGHQQVAVLDGGLKKWMDEGRPVTSKPSVFSKVLYRAHFCESRICDSGAIFDALQNPEINAVLDARAPSRFYGNKMVFQGPLRGGHMPGAYNVPFGSLLSEAGTLKSKEELELIFRLAGVLGKDKMFTTCGSGITACIVSLALEVVGFPSVLYDGSWAEWGRIENDLANFPVEW